MLLEKRSRVDVADSTRVQHETALNRALPLLGGSRLDEITAQHVADLVAALHGDGKARESIRKTVTAAAMVFDHAGVSPNPARDRIVVKLPRDDSEEPNPPTAEQVATVYRLIPRSTGSRCCSSTGPVPASASSTGH